MCIYRRCWILLVSLCVCIFIFPFSKNSGSTTVGKQTSQIPPISIFTSSTKCKRKEEIYYIVPKTKIFDIAYTKSFFKTWDLWKQLVIDENTINQGRKQYLNKNIFTQYLCLPVTSGGARIFTKRFKIWKANTRRSKEGSTFTIK